MQSKRFVLGTVQFGLSYGIANQVGQVNRDEAARILDHAWAAGIDTLDTAISYGESEKRLGEIGVARWQVISKLPAVPENQTDVASWVCQSVRGSLERLRISKLRGLLLHHPRQLLDSRGAVLYRALNELKDQGKVEKIGVSIYGPDELDTLWPRFRFDIVQVPFNIIDRRMIASGWLRRLHEAETEVHVRSVFLQGLLLMDSTKRPLIFTPWQSLWHQWHRWLNAQTLTSLQACLGFALSQPEVDRVVVGVDSLRQLKEILDSAEPLTSTPPESLMCEDLDLINPSRWSVH